MEKCVLKQGKAALTFTVFQWIIHAFFLPASPGLAQTSFSSTLIFALKKYIYIYIYVFMTFHMQHRCLHYIGSLKGLLTIWSIVLWADFISSQVEKQWQGGKKDLSKTRTIETHFYVWTSAFRFLPRHENTHLKQVFRMKWCLHVVWGRYFNQQRKIFFND